MKSYNLEDIKNKIQEYYGDKNYILDKLVYSNINNLIELGCNEHGYFKVIPYNIFKNKISICPKCKRKELGGNVTNLESFISKANKIHNNAYDYSISKYNRNSILLDINCIKHGIFSLIPEHHISKQRGCPKCSKENISLNKEEVLIRMNGIHKNKYLYKDFIYNNILQQIDIICPKHGEFTQKISIHLNGSGCSKCSFRSNNFEFVEKANKIHNNAYDYSPVNYINNITPIDIKCHKHGVFKTKPAYHLQGYGCPICSKNKQNTLLQSQFVEKANKIHNNKYDYSKVKYLGRFDKVTIVCPKHGEFIQTVGDHLQGCGCSSCANTINSSYELEIIDFIKNIDPNTDIIPQYRLNSKELDIYLPKHNLGIEVNGVYWHSHLFKEKNYHKIKSDFFKSQNINVFHIWEYQWNNPNKQSIIKSMILNKIGKTANKIYARKCEVKEINSSDYKLFCNQNHIQGHSPSQIRLGLYNSNKLVAVMGFGKLRINMGNKNPNIDEYELIRYCSLLNHNVVGGASKILSNFIKTYKPIKIISFADNDYSEGKLYKKLGFKELGFTNLSYVYYHPKEGTIKNRFVYRKSELIKKGYDSKLTEFEITHNMGLYRLFNSGIIKFEKM